MIKNLSYQFDDKGYLRLDGARQGIRIPDPFSKTKSFLHKDRRAEDPRYSFLAALESSILSDAPERHFALFTDLKDADSIIIWCFDREFRYLKQQKISVNDLSVVFVLNNIATNSLEVKGFADQKEISHRDTVTKKIKSAVIRIMNQSSIFSRVKFSDTQYVPKNFMLEAVAFNLSRVNCLEHQLLDYLQRQCTFKERVDVLSLWKKILDMNKVCSTWDIDSKGNRRWFSRLVVEFRYHSLRECFALITGEHIVNCPISGRHIRSISSKFVITPKRRNGRAYRLIQYETNGIPFFEIRDFGFHNQTDAFVFAETTLGLMMPPKSPSSWYKGTSLPELTGEVEQLLQRPKRARNLRKIFCNSSGVNLGHYIWNDLTGYLYASDAFKLLRDEVRPEAMFVELEKNSFSTMSYSDIFLGKVQEKIDSKEIQSKTLDSMHKRGVGYHATSFKALSISSDVINIIEQALLEDKSCGNRTNAFSHDVSAHNEIRMFVNVRTHNKSWLNSVDCFKRFLHAERRNAQNMLNLLHIIIESDSSSVELVNRLSEVIQACDVRCTKVLDLDLKALASVIRSSDLMVVPVGSGMVMGTWIFNKISVAHGDPSHMKQLEFWSSVSELSDPANIIALPSEAIRPVCSEFYSNYFIDELIFADVCGHAVNKAYVNKFLQE